ncbi:hypothetical protein HYPSUDRAFT_333942 [Hypholoma sublateritium FD-334 SS-4]|uniref:Uncharacterized protein n=1 Tax=Hypholoma sublateritium (strain FD-334 SS-4) TaxID=945553 RepID=A0A0D2LYG0_HYPSF|nr:hypothetical protein HYPSUDRAFT_333942 [Hypholoma sublateritium FD-334 SS-4]
MHFWKYTSTPADYKLTVMSTTFTLSVSDEKAIMSGFLHSELLNVFLFGLYTPLYFGTMYIYLARKSSTNRIVFTAITVLYLVNIIGSVMLWVDIGLFIGTNGESRSASLLAESTAFTNNVVLGTITHVLPFIVADGLLIWRCFKVWNNSFRTIALSFLLFMAEIALFLSAMVFSLLPSSFQITTTINRLNSAGLFTTLAVTLWTTVLIAYRIYSAARQTLSGTKTHFYNILEIIIQSAFIYSLALVTNAVLSAIPQNDANSLTLFTAENYVGVILYATAAIAPTVMVARVALASNFTSETEPTIAASSIPFGGQNPNINALEVVGHTTVSPEQIGYT